VSTAGEEETLDQTLNMEKTINQRNSQLKGIENEYTNLNMYDMIHI